MDQECGGQRDGGELGVKYERRAYMERLSEMPFLWNSLGYLFVGFLSEMACLQHSLGYFVIGFYQGGCKLMVFRNAGFSRP